MTRAVNIVGPGYGFGYRTDIELIATLLEKEGFAVTRTPLPDISSRARLIKMAQVLTRHPRRFDLNIFTGGIFPEWLPLARRNLSIPNVEDIAGHHYRYLPYIDLFIAKTQLTERAFREMGYRVEYSGFTSRDLYRPGVRREPRTFFHACSSQFKGTKRLLEVWSRHPEWPLLTATINHHPSIPQKQPGNVVTIRRAMTEEEVLESRNAHPFHLCPSEVEGFGHYIVEAMSCRAIALTCDAPPMNELIQPGRGLLIDIQANRPAKGFSHLSYFEEKSLEQTVEYALSLKQVEVDAIGERARDYFLKNREGFYSRFPAIVRSALTLRKKSFIGIW